MENEKRGKILKDKPEGLRYCCKLHCTVVRQQCVDWPEQMTPTSSPWPQLLVPKGLWLHWKMDVSSPLHCTSSSQMSPCPSPKKADPLAARAAPHCSSLHATLALARPQLSSHTVPHLLSWKTSTRPEQPDAPANLIFSQPGCGINKTQLSGFFGKKN